jgi:hypothetical protein
MIDIVERLRLLAAVDNCQASIEAADTITALRTELHTASDMNDVYQCRLQEKEAENEKLRAALQAAKQIAASIQQSIRVYKMTLSPSARTEGDKQ